LLVIDINDYNNLFRIFDLDNDLRISSRDFEKGLKIMRLERFADTAEASKLFDEISQLQPDAYDSTDEPEYFVFKDDFPRLWSPIAQKFRQWLMTRL
jgi:hypothetical protein